MQSRRNILLFKYELQIDTVKYYFIYVYVLGRIRLLSVWVAIFAIIAGANLTRWFLNEVICRILNNLIVYLDIYTVETCVTVESRLFHCAWFTILSVWFTLYSVQFIVVYRLSISRMFILYTISLSGIFTTCLPYYRMFTEYYCRIPTNVRIITSICIDDTLQ